MNQLKNKVIKLRKQNKTYQEIRDILGVTTPKSTLSTWCKGVSMSDYYKIKIHKINIKHLKKIRQLAVQVNKKKQEELYKELINKNKFFVKYLNRNVCKLLLSILYLGEGSKYKSTRHLRLGNSSPSVIKLYLKLLYKCFSINKDKFRVTILCRADQNIKKLENFWRPITNINKKQFYKTRIDKRTIGKKTMKKDYKGVCVVDYFDTKIQLELELLSEQIEKWL